MSNTTTANVSLVTDSIHISNTSNWGSFNVAKQFEIEGVKSVKPLGSYRISPEQYSVISSIPISYNGVEIPFGDFINEVLIQTALKFSVGQTEVITSILTVHPLITEITELNVFDNQGAV